MTRPRNRRTQNLGETSLGKYSKKQSQCPAQGHGTPRGQEISNVRSVLIQEQQILATAKDLRNNKGTRATRSEEEL